MLDNWLQKWYKESYLNASVDSPLSEVWENIESKLDDEPAFWYVSNIASEANNEPVSPKVWEGLNEYLEMQSVMVAQRRWGIVRNIGVATTLLMLPFFLSDYMGSSDHSRSTIHSSTQNPTEDITLSSEVELAQMKGQMILTVENKVIEEHQVIPSKSANKADHLLREIAQEQSSPIELNSNSLQIAPREDIDLIESDFVSLPILPVDLAYNYSRERVEGYQNNTNSIKPTGVWRLGVGINNQFSSLQNPITLQGFDQSSHIDLSLSSNFSFDFSVERKIGRLSYLGITARLNDQKTQKYQVFVGTQYLEKQLSLHYNSLCLKYSRAILAKKLNNRFGLEFNTGVYVSHLSGVTEKWNNQDRYELTSGFRAIDVGAMVGLNGVFRVSNRFEANLGMYYTNGAMNVFKGIDVMPAHFFRTFTSSFGGSVGIRYDLGSL